MAKADLSLGLWGQAALSGVKDLAYPQHLRERARDIAYETVVLASASAMADVALANTLSVTVPAFARQKAEFARARTLAPGNTRIVAEFARFALYAAHTRYGVEAAEQAATLSPTSVPTYFALAWNLFLARRPNDALVAIRHAQELGTVPPTQVKEITGFIALLQGDPALAQLACNGLITFTGHQCHAIAYQAVGKPAEASAELE
jgi:hypothetical protein